MGTPQEYIEQNPTTQSIQFGGRYISLSAIARRQRLDISYLSRIFNCHRTPRVKYIQKLAKALDMSLDEFMDAMDKRRRVLSKMNGSPIK